MPPSRIEGTDAHAGSPVWRSAQRPNVLRAPIVPFRCPLISSTTSAVATSAPAVAPTASPSAAPPAGSCPVDWANAGPAAISVPRTAVPTAIRPQRICLAPSSIDSRIATGSSRNASILTDQSVSYL